MKVYLSEALRATTLDEALSELADIGQQLEDLAFDLAFHLDSETVAGLLVIVRELDRFLESFPRHEHELLKGHAAFH